MDKLGRERGKKIALSELAAQIPRNKRRKVTWREGTKGDLSAKFAFRRVVPTSQKLRASEREEIWLVIEWEEGQTKPSSYSFVSLPKSTAKKKLVRIIKQRWRTERVYQELKGELGLDHYEGRRYPGWHHHVSVALCCYAFVVSERSRSFSPSEGGKAQDSPNLLAA